MSCKGCEKRFLGCHDTCPEYKKFREEQQRIKEARQNERMSVRKPAAQVRKIEEYQKRYGK